MKHGKRNDDSNLMQSTNTRLRNMRIDRNHSFIPLPHTLTNQVQKVHAAYISVKDYLITQ